MSLTQKLSDVITGNRSRTFLSDETDDVLFNATINIMKANSGNITSHAIEKGAEIQDHIHYEPETITVMAIITDADLQLTDPTSFLEKSVQERLDQLLQWRIAKEPLIFYSYEEDIENVVIEDIQEMRSVDLGKGRELQLTFKQLNIADSQEVSIAVPIPRVGSTPTRTVSTPAPPPASRSFLRSLFGG